MASRSPAHAVMNVTCVYVCVCSSSPVDYDSTDISSGNHDSVGFLGFQVCVSVFLCSCVCVYSQHECATTNSEKQFGNSDSAASHKQRFLDACFWFPEHAVPSVGDQARFEGGAAGEVRTLLFHVSAVGCLVVAGRFIVWLNVGEYG